MSLEYNELILLDALAYYREFSDFLNMNLPDGEQHDIGTFVNYALNEKYTTCFNDGLGPNSDEPLGMKKILELVKTTPELTKLEFVYPTTANENTSSACLIDPETKEVYVIFGGNYIEGKYEYTDKDGDTKEMGTWADNFIGAFVEDTEEQKRALDFYIDAIAAARDAIGLTNGEPLDITVSGHSAAGNQAQYVTIAY